METSRKIELLEDMFELDEGTLKPETRLKDISAWDSMTKLSLIALLDEEFDKVLTGDDIKKLVIIKDILAIMQ